MRKRILAILLIVFCGTANAATISGKLERADLTIVIRTWRLAAVDLIQNEQVIRSARVSRLGAYRFTNVPPGEYVLVARMPFYNVVLLPSARRADVLNANDELTFMDFWYRRPIPCPDGSLSC